MYRPQFPFPASPKNCEDERCHFSFDGTNTPRLLGTIPANTTYTKIPLLLDQDADFLIRAIQISVTVLLVGIEDANGHPLIYPTGAGLPPTLKAPLWGQCDGGPIVTLDSDNWGIFCRRAGRLLAYIQNTTGAPVNAPIITVHGVKRFTGALCK